MNNTLLKIYEFNIRENTLYQVTEKLDTSAPEGFKEYKTSKIIHPDISNSEPVAVFDTALGIWDTGLYENSSALRKAIPSQDERSKFIKDVTKYIVTPLTKLKGKEYLSPQSDNNDFWDNYRVNIFKDKIFNTEKPEELLQLYLAILHKHVTPKVLESNPEFKNCQFCIVDKEDSVDRKLETEMGMLEAHGIFYSLLKSKKEDLFLVLDYLKLSIPKNTDDKILVSLFNNWLKDKTDGFQNYNVFLKTHKMLSTKDGERELFYYSKVKDLIKSRVLKQRKTEVWLEEEFLGEDLKATVNNILNDKELEERIVKFIE